MDDTHPPIVVMGVSGSGKSTIGRMLAMGFTASFMDADDLHPQANKDKMAAGIPLDDVDRAPWLELVGQALAGTGQDGSAAVVACSALKRRYRDVLRRFAPDAFFAHLIGPPELIGERLGSRDHEFMPASLLRSQFASLEPLEPDERGASVDLTSPPDEIVAQIAEALERYDSRVSDAT